MLCNDNWYNTCDSPGMRVCLIFYRTVALPLVTISLVSAYQVWQAHSVYFIIPVFWVKILTTVIIGVFITVFRSEQFIFFYNLGYSRVKLYGFSFLFDFMIWSVLMCITAKMI